MPYNLTLTKVLNKQVADGKADERRFTIAINGVPDAIPQCVAYGAVETALLKGGGNLGQERFWNAKDIRPGAVVSINWSDIQAFLEEVMNKESDNALILYQACRAIIDGRANEDQRKRVAEAEIPAVTASNVQRVLALVKAKALIGAVSADQVQEVKARIINLIG